MPETSPPTPSWAQSWNPDDYTAFIRDLQAELQERNLTSQLNPEEGTVTFRESEDEDERSISLQGLATICANQGDATTFPQTIRQQVELLLTGYTDSVTASDLDNDWERAQQRVKVRLHHLNHVLDNREFLTFRPIGGNLAAVLVYDLPESIFSVDPAVAEAWPVSNDEMWDVALQNVLNEEPPPDIAEVNLGDSRAIAAYGDSYFISTRILLLSDIINTDDYPHGALVALPHRHTMLFHPISTRDNTIVALNELILAADQIFSEEEGPFSNHIFWWTPRRIERIPATIDDEAQELIIDPPDSFVDLINQLPLNEE